MVGFELSNVYLLLALTVGILFGCFVKIMIEFKQKQIGRNDNSTVIFVKLENRWYILIIL